MFGTSEKEGTRADSFDSADWESDASTSSSSDDEEDEEENGSSFDDEEEESGDDDSTQSTSEANSDHSPPRPSPPNRVTSPGSVSVTQTVGKNGERVWITETVLSDGNIQRITTSTPPPSSPDLEKGIPSVTKDKQGEDDEEEEKSKCCKRFDCLTKFAGCIDSIVSLISTFWGGFACVVLVITVAGVTTGVVLSNKDEPTPAPTTREPVTTAPTTQSPTTMVPTTNPPTTQEPTVPIIENNDFCDDATSVQSDGKEILGTTFNATAVSSDFNTCGQPRESSVWYRVTGSGERITISTCSQNTNMDTKIVVYSSGVCPDDTCMYSIPYFRTDMDMGGRLATSSGGDNGCELSSASTSSVVFDSMEGQEYKLFIAGDALGQEESVFGLTVTSHSAPDNDSCINGRLVEPDGVERVESTANATISTEFDSCGMWRDSFGRSYHIQGGTVWYRVIGTGERISVSTCSDKTDFDTKIAVYATSSCADSTCLLSIPYFRNDEAMGGTLASNAEDTECILSPSKASTVVFDSELGEEYKFYVADTYGRRDGTFGLTVTSYTAPNNDACSSAQLVESNGVELLESTVNATVSTEVDSCVMWYDSFGRSYHIQGATVWYSVIGTGQRISISTCSDKTDIDTKIAVYATASCADNTCLLSIPYFRDEAAMDGPLASNAEDPSCILTGSKASTVVFDSEDGQEYKFYVADTQGRLDGSFGLTVTSYIAPENDACTSAKLVEPNGVEVEESTRNATVSTEFDSCGMWYDSFGRSYHIQGATVWYRVIGTGERISVSTCSVNTNIDTKIAVYATSSCADSSCLLSLPYFRDGVAMDGPLASNAEDPDCILTSSGSTVVFDSDLGQEYKFYVADTQGRLDGTFGLTVTSHVPPDNDACSSARLAQPNGVEIVDSTTNATVSTEFDSCGMWYDSFGRSYHIQGATVWYRIIGSGQRISVSTCSEMTTSDTKIAVYATSSCADNTCLLGVPYFRDGVAMGGPLASNAEDPDCDLTLSGSTVVFDSELGQEYKFYVADAYGRLDETFGLVVTDYNAPANDVCSNAKLVEANGVEIVESTENATISTEFDSCGMWHDSFGRSYHIQGATLWYRIIGTGERFTVSTCSTSTTLDTKMAVYANDGCGDDTCLQATSNDNDPDCILTNAGTSTVSFDTEAGVSYKFFVADSYGRLDGTFGLRVDSEVLV